MMNKLQTVLHDGIEVVDSREVAEMVERDHKELLKTIRLYCDYLAEGNFAPGDFFLENTYFDANNQSRPCYLITKKGCDMIANKMTGAKGIQFTAAYVNAFHRMKQQIQKTLSPAQLIAAQAQVLVDMEQRMNQVENLLLDVGSKAEEAVTKLDTAIKVYSTPDKDHWQVDIAASIKEMVEKNGWAEPKYRGLLYKELERAAGKNITSRLTNLQKRMRKSGMTYRDSQRLTKLDAIAADKDLRMLFEGIVKKHQAQVLSTTCG